MLPSRRASLTGVSARVLVDEYDAYIIVSFVNATLVLSIGETVEEVTDSGFLGTTPTLSCSQLGDDALVQVGPFSQTRRCGQPPPPRKPSITLIMTEDTHFMF